MSALLIGLLGSSHCLLMCGGLGGVLGCTGEHGLGRLCSYNLGRLMTYAAIGAVAGLLGEQIIVVSPSAALLLRAIAGLLMVAMGLYISQWWMGLTRLEKLGANLWRHIQPLTRSLLPVKNLKQAFKLGMLWGFLPCGLVYSTLSWSLAAAQWQQSALFMLAFGVGTLPAMLSLGFISEKFLFRLRQGKLRSIAGVLIIAMGLLTLAVPLSHSLQSDQHQHVSHS
jgi:sulfite exporter TauE/SafE